VVAAGRLLLAHAADALIEAIAAAALAVDGETE